MRKVSSNHDAWISITLPFAMLMYVLLRWFVIDTWTILMLGVTVLGFIVLTIGLIRNRFWISDTSICVVEKGKSKQYSWSDVDFVFKSYQGTRGVFCFELKDIEKSKIRMRVPATKRAREIIEKHCEIGVDHKLF